MAMTIGPDPQGKWAWSCGQCGDWSKGYRYASEEAARKGAERHGRKAVAVEERIHRILHGVRKESQS
jgi:hypothetical protein